MPRTTHFIFRSTKVAAESARSWPLLCSPRCTDTSRRIGCGRSKRFLMITKRLFAVELLLAAGLGTVFLLPQAPKTKPAGISLKLPISVGNWIGDDAAVTQREIEVLAKDTQFARKVYTGPEGDV